MFEQVPEHLLPEFFARAYTLLRPGGVFVNQGIARHVDFEQSARRGDSFIDRYVFPDGGVVPISMTLAAAEGQGSKSATSRACASTTSSRFDTGSPGSSGTATRQSPQPTS